MLKETSDLLKQFYQLDDEVFKLSEEVMEDIKEQFDEIKEIREFNQYKVLKAMQEAKKNLVEVPIVDTTVPHEFVGKFGSAKVLLKPAAVGTGLIAGGSVRPVLELAGYKNRRTKVIGTNNPRNVVYATIEGLKNMRTIEQVAKKRNKKVDEIM